jgi:ureidoacrylate peracid hydrolase
MHEIAISQDVVDRVIARRGRLHLYDSLDPARTALVVIDMQNAFCKPGAPVEVPASRDVVPAINALAGALRERGSPPIWITSEFRSAAGKTDWENFFGHIVASAVRGRTMAYMAPGAEGAVLWHALDARPEDIHLVKNRYSALAPGASLLERTLRSHAVDTLLVAGTKTNVCCEATARAAFDTDFKVVMVSDCCAALSEREHQSALENAIQQFADVMTSDEVVACLE